MIQYIKRFKTYDKYQEYINDENRILPNLSYCEENNDVHYNPSPFYLTPKEILTFIFNMQKDIQRKYNYNLTWEQEVELTKNLYNIEKTFAIRIRNLEGICQCIVTIYKNVTVNDGSVDYEDELLDLDIHINFYASVSGTYKGGNLSYDFRMIPSILDEWNDNYVLRGNAYLEQTGDGYEFNSEEWEYFNTHLCLIFPKTVTGLTSQEELAQISIGFVDDNGNYTFT